MKNRRAGDINREYIGGKGVDINMRQRVTPLEKEWIKLQKQEQDYLQKRIEKKDSRFNRLIESKVPEKLQGTLKEAFAKAFYLVFEKGTGIIEKTYNREGLEKDYQINEYADEVRQNRKSLKVFSKKAANAGNVNLLLSGVSGIGLGILGIGIPDIVLFTGLMLKGIYEIALNYGYDYEAEQEKRFILLLIQGAVAYGDELREIDSQLNFYIENGYYDEPAQLKEMMDKAADGLSKELLYMKFLQGIPVIGAAGGAYDVVYMKQVTKYAQLKYRHRFYYDRK